ncbi:hypothetical protein V7134_10860 [Priestia megaterium]|uniref:hypothetical protein n=1 Tax=Priestia megaterium TaxID=1404 RepID=UPI002FFD8AC5
MRTSLSEQEIPNRDLYYHEVKQLLDYYKDHTINYGLLTMLAMTGLRVQEIANACFVGRCVSRQLKWTLSIERSR